MFTVITMEIAKNYTFRFNYIRRRSFLDEYIKVLQESKSLILCHSV